jgi:hypothetical protein
MIPRAVPRGSGGAHEENDAKLKAKSELPDTSGRLARSQQKEGANVERPLDEERTEEAEEETLVVSIRRRFTRARPLGGLFCWRSGGRFIRPRPGSTRSIPAPALAPQPVQRLPALCTVRVSTALVGSLRSPSWVFGPVLSPLDRFFKHIAFCISNVITARKWCDAVGILPRSERAHARRRW